jgi:hypothetical protein
MIGAKADEGKRRAVIPEQRNDSESDARHAPRSGCRNTDVVRHGGNGAR